MRILKKPLVVISIGLILLGVLIFYSLSPTIKNVSEESILKPHLGKQVLKTVSYLTKCKKGQYTFLENQLATSENCLGERVLVLVPGSGIIIDQFKTYTSNIGAGFTYLYALGYLNDAKGNKINFEYDLGTVGKNLYEKESFELPKVAWQDANSKSIRIPAEN